MKKLTFILLITVLCSNLIGQNNLSVSLNLIESGRDLTIDYSRFINNKHEIGGGIRININRIAQQDDQSNIYFRRLYASEFYQYLGIHAFYHRRIIEKWQCLMPYLFYDLQVTKSTTRTSMFIPAAIDNHNNILYLNFIEYFGPFVWIDQNIGLGFRVNIFQSIYLDQKFGLGSTWIIGEDNQLPQKSKYCEYELGYLITFGVSIKF
jgi:hypothetical protein